MPLSQVAGALSGSLQGHFQGTFRGPPFGFLSNCIRASACPLTLVPDLNGGQIRNLSSKNKLLLMILKPPEQTAETCIPTENCTFLMKNSLAYRNKTLSCRKKALSCRKRHFPAEKRGFQGAHGKKLRESAGGFQGSRVKDTNQLSQETWPCVPPLVYHQSLPACMLQSWQP